VLVDLHGGLRLLVHVLEVLGDLLVHLGFVIGNLPAVVDDGFHHRVAVLDSQHPLGGGVKQLHVLRVIVALEIVKHLLIVELHFDLEFLGLLGELLTLLVPHHRPRRDPSGCELVGEVLRYLLDDRTLHQVNLAVHEVVLDALVAHHPLDVGLGELVDRGAAFLLVVRLPHGLVLSVAYVSSYHYPDQLVVRHLLDKLGHRGLDQCHVKDPALVQVVAVTVSLGTFRHYRGEASTEQLRTHEGSLAVDVSPDHNLGVSVLLLNIVNHFKYPADSSHQLLCLPWFDVDIQEVQLLAAHRDPSPKQVVPQGLDLPVQVGVGKRGAATSLDGQGLVAEEVLEDARLRKAGLIKHGHVEPGLGDDFLQGLLLLEGIHAPHVPDTDGHGSPLPTSWERLLGVNLALRCPDGFLASVLIIRA